jgi:amino acid adenylation domain-containing protein
VVSSAVAAPLNPAYSAEESEFYLRDLAPAALIVDPELDCPAASAAARLGIPVWRWIRAGGWFELEGQSRVAPSGDEGPPQPDDVALLLHTSGSTSRPKLVPLTHANLCYSAQNIAASLELTSDDRCLNVMPLFHVHGLMGAVLSSLSVGASVVCTPGFHAPEFLNWLGKYQPTWYTAVPTMHQAILGRVQQLQIEPVASNLRLIRSCSSALPPQTMAGLERVFRVPVVEAYGMTEASHQMTINPLPPLARKPGSVGLPTGCEVAVVDDAGQPVSDHVTGHIVIRGRSVTRGYAHNPEANAASFSGGWFHTGDRGHLDSDGYVFLTGRTKEIINRGGEKISPREIDELLMTHPAVAQAMAFALPDSRLGEDIGVLVVPGKSAQASTETATLLRQFVAQHLADFKVPRQIYFVDELPKGPTGKPQRIGAAQRLGLIQPTAQQAQPTAQQAQPTAQQAMEAGRVSPRTEPERILSAIWQQVLRVDRVEVNDEFLELGGDSILAAQIVARVREEFRIDLPLFRLFDNCTIAKLAQDLAAPPATLLPDVIEKVPRNGPLPLSPEQERMWFLSKLGDERSAYITPTGLRLKGPLRRDALRASLQRIISRHEILRTVYPDADGTPSQTITYSDELSIAEVDLETLPPDAQSARVTALVRNEVQRGFDLASEIPLRVHLVKLGLEDNLLLLIFHHIASDGWSRTLFLQELAHFYNAFVAKKPASIDDLPLQYADYAAWRGGLVSGAYGEKLLAYWKEQMSGAAPVLEIPTDRPRPSRQTFHGAIERRLLPKELADELQSLGRREGATLFMVLLAGFHAVLSRYSGQSDICIGAPVAHRIRKETESLVGFFVNTLVLRCDSAADRSFRQLLGGIRHTALGAYEHQSLPFEQLVECMVSERSLSHSALIQVMFQLQNFPDAIISMDGLEASGEELDAGTAPFDLSLRITEVRDGLICSLNYNSDLFDASTAGRILAHYKTLLAAAVRNPDAPMSDLPILTEAEQHQLLVEWNQTTAEYPKECAHQLFEKQVLEAPKAAAAILERHAWTYEELDRRANQLAGHLRARGVGRGDVVAVCLERSKEMLAALLGIWKSGAAYVPLDPSHPSDRNALIVEDAHPALVLTQKSLRRIVALSAAPIALLEDWPSATIAVDTSSKGTPEDLAYILYTSGSTGQPKGVAVQHGSLTNLLEAMRRELGVTRSDKLFALTTISFDISILELFLPLVTGACVVIGPSDVARDAGKLASAIEHSGATLVQATPTAWEVLLETGWRPSKSLKIVCGGEPLPDLLAKRLAGSCQLWNAYGPTETTIWSTLYRFTPGETGVRIGRPLSNTQLYVLDANRQPVPVGVPGELYIAGDGVAAGYWRRPELTAERFVENPFVHRPSKMYRTGDLVRYLPNGNLEFLRRSDAQVKIRGFRVELGEIESVLRQHTAVVAAAATVIEDAAHGKQLAAYYVKRGDSDSLQQDLRVLLEGKLPSYMIPPFLAAVEELPLTNNGKIDRKSLPGLSRPILPPSQPSVDMVELMLTHIWEDVLKRRPILTDDNFFDIGGHSLLGARLLARVEKAFNERLGLIDFFEAPTIRQMADLLRKRQARIRSSQVIPVQSNGERTPVFMLGLMPLFRPLLLRMADDQPLFGLSQPDPAIREIEPRAEKIAACYIETLRQGRAHGPYVIAGWCRDGVLAYEMAQQLSAAGEQVPLILLFDAFNPRLQELENWARWTARLQFHLNNLAEIRIQDIPAYCAGRLRTMMARAKGILWRTAYKFRLLADRRVDHLTRDWTRLMTLGVSAYQPQPYEGRILLIRPKERPPGPQADCAYGWKQLARNLEVVDVPGNHVEMFREPNVRLMANSVENALREINSLAPLPDELPQKEVHQPVVTDPKPGRGGVWRRAAAILGAMLLFYLIPTGIEIGLAKHLPPVPVYLVVGDLLGCAAIAIFDWKRGLALYSLLTVCELILFRTGFVSFSGIQWLTDLAPTAVISLLIAARSAAPRTPRS